jgi:hypothetical protein
MGFVIARLLFDFDFSGFDQMLFLIAGFSLYCGAFTSYYGNLAWMMPSFFAPKERPQARNPRTCSVIIGTIGAALIILPITLHLVHYGWPGHRTSSMDANTFVLHDGRLQPLPRSSRSTPTGLIIFDLFLAALPGFLLVRALRTGTGYWWCGAVDRDDTPLYFWFYVILNGLAVVCILSTLG